MHNYKRADFVDFHHVLKRMIEYQLSTKLLKEAFNYSDLTTHKNSNIGQVAIYCLLLEPIFNCVFLLQ